MLCKVVIANLISFGTGTRREEATSGGSVVTERSDAVDSLSLPSGENQVQRDAGSLWGSIQNVFVPSRADQVHTVTLSLWDSIASQLSLLEQECQASASSSGAGYCESEEARKQYERVFQKFKHLVLSVSMEERWQFFQPSGVRPGDSLFRSLLLYQCKFEVEPQKPAFDRRNDDEYPYDLGYKHAEYMTLAEDAHQILSIFKEKNTGSDFYLKNFVYLSNARNLGLDEPIADIELNIYANGLDKDIFDNSDIDAILPFLMLPKAPIPRYIKAWHSSLLVKVRDTYFIVNADGGFMDVNNEDINARWNVRSWHCTIAKVNKDDLAQPSTVSEPDEDVCDKDVCDEDVLPPSRNSTPEEDQTLQPKNMSEHKKDKVVPPSNLDEAHKCRTRATDGQRLVCIFKTVVKKKYLDNTLHFYQPNEEVGGKWVSEASFFQSGHDGIQVNDDSNIVNLMQRVSSERSGSQITGDKKLVSLMHPVNPGAKLKDIVKILRSLQFYNLGRRNCQHATALIYAMLTGHVMTLPLRIAQLGSYIALADQERETNAGISIIETWRQAVNEYTEWTPLASASFEPPVALSQFFPEKEA
eukprot:TRINITY_DN45414_c0_g1_i1.p1 TRINITY_DN45414_c0_g1~~TRINITY_DN45414_c0_g1_i1.p1  ORF type:complete len:585 (+),score=62.28 TRINITY_DN45414_c0_g1_i1:87-1841(+)